MKRAKSVDLAVEDSEGPDCFGGYHVGDCRKNKAERPTAEQVAWVMRHIIASIEDEEPMTSIDLIEKRMGFKDHKTVRFLNDAGLGIICRILLGRRVFEAHVEAVRTSVSRMETSLSNYVVPEYQINTALKRNPRKSK